jgi:hypothetical protein
MDRNLLVLISEIEPLAVLAMSSAGIGGRKRVLPIPAGGTSGKMIRLHLGETRIVIMFKPSAKHNPFLFA